MARGVIATTQRLEKRTGKPVVLIVIDTLSRALCGGDENSPKDMGAIVRTTGNIQHVTGAHVMWLHHVPHEVERMRGHSSLLGALDTTIHVARSGNIGTATIVKANNSDEGEQVAFTVEKIVTTRNAAGMETTAEVVIPAAAPADKGKKPKGRTLKQSAKIALRALEEVIAEQGDFPPASEYIPDDVKVVSIDAWRAHAVQRELSSAKDEKSKHRTFTRAYDSLLSASVIGCWQDSVWATGDGDKGTSGDKRGQAVPSHLGI